MSDHIAHIAVCDDTFRLSLCLPSVDPTLKRAMTDHRPAAHMGSVTRGADKWSADITLWAAGQQRLPEAQRDPRWLEKLAFVLGALTHRAADRLTKPITNCWKGSPDSPDGGDANESKIMQDIFVFKEVFGSGEGALADPFTAAALATPANEGQAMLETCFRVLWRRALIAMHTIDPDSGHIHNWMDRFLDSLQTFPKSLAQYAQLASEWDSNKVRKYLLEKNFYRRDDAIILVARALQRGATVSPDAVSAAVAGTNQSNSRYARALAKALDYLHAAGDLLAGRIGIDQARTGFDVGVPELSLKD